MAEQWHLRLFPSSTEMFKDTSILVAYFFIHAVTMVLGRYFIVGYLEP